ncbi:PPOX class probable F420-dependent enzyme [Nocardioides aromaticivorans]|uniref:PPOX class probable F420-dependent enzyme n=1 Tax=Nocardioides aromaticivorans TaxID=200618 RepID=A0A7Y9ZGX8_9ACTN|nr:PPOX class F420-dependent oxidoreductase [Nocardioides aromaticivorans]NYI45237.1 PPOX class probable F420-dependent enzyme [Nocardioides aromaticivorans]
MPVWEPVVWTALPPTLAEFWTERHLCTLSTLDRDGAPHAVAVGAVLDPELECAWVITDGGSQKVANLRRDGRLAVSQVDGARWSTIIGTAEVLSDAVSVERACERYAARYRTPRENPNRVALRITVERFLGSSQVLPPA